MSRRLCILLLIILAFPLAAFAQDAKQSLNEQLWEAARKGDAVAVRTLLDKGADVNAKFRYGATALSYASDKGHVEVVKVLLERGADVNVRDTFYNVTPLQWAMEKGHTAIIKALLDKGAEGVDEVLMSSVRNNNEELVSHALAKGNLKPETLTAALVASSDDEKKARITELLKKAGAMPPPEVAAEILQSYVGKYKSERGTEISVTTKEGKLYAAVTGQNPFNLTAVNNTTFRPTAFDAVIVFNVEGGKTVSFSFKQQPTTTLFKKVE